jgi:transketolase
MSSSRDAFGEGLLNAGRVHPNLFVLTAEMKGPTRCDIFAVEFPDRFIDVGIAEQNLIGIGAGLAACGKIPFLVSYANFTCLRAGEQIRNDISYTNFNVKVVAMSTGFTFGTGGATHQSYEDVGVMRAMPNFVVLVPADAASVKKAVLVASNYVGPVFMRSGRDKEYDVYTKDDCPFNIGKANLLRSGDDIAIIACGFMVHEAIEAAELLGKEGLSTCVIDMHTIKPIDSEILNMVANRCKVIITVEEHYIIGGLGTAVLDALSERVHPPVCKIGIEDRYPPIGPTFELREHLGLAARPIAQKALGFYKNFLNNVSGAVSR